MNAAVAYCLVFCGLVVTRIAVRKPGENLSLVGVFFIVWGCGLVALIALTDRVQYSTADLAKVFAPFAVVGVFFWPTILTNAPVCAMRYPSRCTWTAFWVCFTVSAVLLAFDVGHFMLIARSVDPVLILKEARELRQQGSFYGPVLGVVNPLRLMLAPIAWSLLTRGECLIPQRQRLLLVAALFVAFGGMILSTGRSAVVLSMVWLTGITMYSAGARWGLKGLTIRFGIVAALGAAFFVFYGLAIGKTGESLSIALSTTGTPQAPLLASSLSFLLYVAGPIAALSNTSDIYLQPSFRLALVYPVVRVLSLAGIDVPVMSRSLPYTGIPFSFNTYTSIGPAYWIGGVVGIFMYLCLVLSLLTCVQTRVARQRDVPGSVLYGFMMAAAVLSLSSDYFISAGFAYVVYAYWGLERLISKRGPA